MEIHLPNGNTIIDQEFAEMIQQTARLMVETAATINGEMTRLERTCPYGNEPSIIGVIDKMRRASGDLTLQWQDLDSTLLNYDLRA